MWKLVLPLFLVAANATKWSDCDGPSEDKLGPYTSLDFHQLTWDGTIFKVLMPHTTNGPWPLAIFMHGSTGQFEMYAAPVDIAKNLSAGLKPLNLYASHGFAVIFPYVKSPDEDKSPFTTNTDGEFIIKALEFARVAQSDNGSPLKGAVDLQNVVSIGHSMGGTCSIMAGKRLPAGDLKGVVTQHPGICGPFGPPPWPATWMESDLAEVSRKTPILFTTATNDGAFWPAPATAKHELGCFQGAQVKGPAAFAQFSEKACAEDSKSLPWTDAGHNCPFKPDVESPWVLRFLKLYAQLGGDSNSRCHSMLWGSDSDSLRNSSMVEHAVVVVPAVYSTVVVV